MKAKWLTAFSACLPSPSNPHSTLGLCNLSSLLSSYAREGRFRLGFSLHASILKNSTSFDFQDRYSLRNLLVVWNSLISMYAQRGKLANARKVFDAMPIRDTVSYNAMISCHLRLQGFENGFLFFKQMLESTNFRIDHATLTTILSVCDSRDRLYMLETVHSIVFWTGFECEIAVGNALVTGYFKCGCVDAARSVFDEMPERNIISWTAAISGFVQSDLCGKSLFLFGEMRRSGLGGNSFTYSSSITACSGVRAIGEGKQIHALVLKYGFNSDLCVESSLMDMYSKCGSMADACRIFYSANEFDEVSMTVMLVGFAQNGMEEEAVELFVSTVKAGMKIDSNMVSAILGVFGVVTSLSFGKQIHSLVIKNHLKYNLHVGNGLINMYSKCGEFEESIKVFNSMAQRNSISWNCMIAGFARHGHGLEALQFYERMKLEGMELTDVTFLSLLHACSHMGLIEKGMELLESMSVVHGISPRMEHYACVVDMLGRAGHLKEAKCFIEGMPVEPGIVVWQALLGACSVHGDAEMGRYAADCLLLIECECAAAYILLANIFSSQRKWKERALIIKKMKENGVKKEIGMSWIEIEKDIHSFVVGDTAHPQADIIYEVLDELITVMTDEGYLPNKKFVLYDSDV